MIVRDDETGIAAVVDSLRHGHVCAIPTDTLYALAASLDHPGAIDAIFSVKQRARGVVLPVLCADLHQADALGALRGDARVAAERYWPGPLTIVCPRRPGFTADLGDDHDTVGLRVPDHDGSREVMRWAGALATSSANRHRGAQPTSVRGIVDLFGDQVSVVLDDTQPVSRPASGVASTVVRADTDGRLVEILRRGHVDPADLGL